ncbi:MAG: transketolase [Deltaproteobacteria bacterium]|nr:transketolase [Deltaproteobacteria bacterium]
MQDQQLVNLFKGLVIDGVHHANSGHPGGPMSSMDLAYLLYSEFLQFDPDNPKWLGRDRFILSAGHMSMLQYAMLYGIGWLGIDDLKSFRQHHSRTPGHPENFQTPGVECTTGPLGQGCAMSLGFAIAARHLGSVLDKELYNYRTWVLCSDGDLQEGVALGSASLAGHLKLGNLVWIYDKNHIQLSGPTNKCISDDYVKVFSGFGWQVLSIDGHNHAAIRRAYETARKTSDRPTIIIADTVMGKGCATLEGTAKTHGSPLPEAERQATKANLGIPDGESFYAPSTLRSHFQRNFAMLRATAKAWHARQEHLLETSPEFRARWVQHYQPVESAKLSPVPWTLDKDIPTRNAFGDIIKHWASELPQLFGGSADLEPSNMTGAFAKGVGDFDAEHHGGRNLNFGVREFPMSALCNGIALHGGLIPFDATFLSFADYSRAALRLGAIQRVRVIHEFTHDSFYLGEDGPTHQPVEQVMALRLIPKLYVMRPADPQETEVLMRRALELELPSALCLTRQKVPYLKLPKEKLAHAARGAYIVHDTPDADLLILATGSEVGLALAAAAQLKDYRTRVVSMPCWELFAEQTKTYQESVLPRTLTRRVSIEAGATLGWERFTGLQGLNIGVDHYGESAPAEVLAKEYGFTAEAICERIAKHFPH